MTTDKLYSRDKVWQMLHDAEVHGRFSTLLRRENIRPTKDQFGHVWYDADEIDSLIAMIKL